MKAPETIVFDPADYIYYQSLDNMALELENDGLPVTEKELREYVEEDLSDVDWDDVFYNLFEKFKEAIIQESTNLLIEDMKEAGLLEEGYGYLESKKKLNKKNNRRF